VSRPAAEPALTLGDPAHPTAWFLHANGFPPRGYQPFLEHLAQRLHVVAWNTRPVLRPEPEPIEWHQLAYDVLDAEPSEPIIAIGHSMGATAWTLAAASRPERFRALVAIEPALVRPWQAWLIRRIPVALVHRLGPSGPTLKKRDQWPDEAGFRASCAKSGLYEGLSAAAFDAFVASALRTRSDGSVELAYPKRWEAHFFSIPPAPGVAMSRVRCPVVGVRGESSFYLDDVRWNQLLAGRHDAWTRQLDGVGHLAPFEAPERVAEAVLAGLDATGVL
jgi:pimeloyl-ACP methyl ester carboxylesterase